MLKVIKLILFILIGIQIELNAQVTVSLGTKTGQGSTNVLLSTSTTVNKYSRTISIYSASEIIGEGGTAGNITKLAWDKNGTGEYQFNDAYIKIYLKHVTNSEWSTSPVPDWTNEVVGATEVYTSSTYSIPVGTGWKEVIFTTPFAWNGIDNIAIFVEWYRPSTPTGDIAWGRSTTTNANASRVGSTSLAALVMLINSNRPIVQLTINSNAVPITNLTVSTQGGVPAVINTFGGNLQMVATILPSNANQAVNWNIIPVTGTASISAAGLVTALTDGTVWAKAVSIQDATKKDSLLITISNQNIAVTSLTVNTQGSIPPIINTYGGNLQMLATILPASANQNVNWSIIPVSGTATVSSTGLVTALTNGTVWVKAISVQNATKKDSMLITISNQIVPITNLTVSTQGGIPALINTNGGNLQMVATILPANANQNVSWNVVQGTGSASVSSTGLVTALTNGTVWAKAVSVQDATKKDSILITISNQIIPITNLTVSTQGGIPAVINTNGGNLQMVATILPSYANQNVNWSVISGTGAASISSTGLVTALTNGTVWAKAVSVQDATKKDSLLITISNQIIPITNLSVTTQGGIPALINTKNGTLQLIATILPANANQNVNWSVISVTGTASVSSTGLVTALTNGTVWVKAISVQDVSKKDSLLITITNQDIGIDKIINSNILTIYPNPANSNNELFIKINEAINFNETIINIIDEYGKLIKSDMMTSSSTKIKLNNFKPGIYFVKIKNNSNKWERKLAIE